MLLSLDFYFIRTISSPYSFHFKVSQYGSETEIFLPGVRDLLRNR